MNTVMVLLQMVVALCLAYSCFCRLVRTDAETIREVRLAIWFQAMAAGLVAGAPILPLLVPEITWRAGTTPRWIWLVLLVAATFVQVVASRYWRNGMPRDFQKG
ncbi:hypothetical protein D9M73_70760 [compost metagenome]|nr:MAG TPA: hypothetical protein [Caudoviricetes sp.]